VEDYLVEGRQQQPQSSTDRWIFRTECQQIAGYLAHVKTDSVTENNTMAAIQCLVAGDTLHICRAHRPVTKG